MRGFRKKVVISPVMFIFLFCGQVFSQNDEFLKDLCVNPATQLEINECARHEYQNANTELEKIYRQLLISLTKAGDRGKSQKRLKQTQLLWIKYRGAHCNTESSNYAGGSNFPAIKNKCLASVTGERVRRLKDFLDEIKLLF